VLYRVRGLTFGLLEAVAPRAPLWVEHGIDATGAALATIGLRPPILWPEEAVLVVVERLGA
jgi:alpha-galactosidase